MAVTSVVDNSSSLIERSAADIENWLQTRIAGILAVAESGIDVRLPFADFGLDSAVMVSITIELSQWLDREVSVTAMWEYTTIEELSRSV